MISILCRCLHLFEFVLYILFIINKIVYLLSLIKLHKTLLQWYRQVMGQMAWVKEFAFGIFILWLNNYKENEKRKWRTYKRLEYEGLLVVSRFVV